MIADIIKSNYDARFITMNVMSVFSNNKDYIDKFIYEIINAQYLVNNKIIKAKNIISYPNVKINIYKNIYRIANKNINISKFYEYLDYFNLRHTLWMKLYQLDKDQLTLIKLLLQLSSDKPIIITDYLDKNFYKTKIYSLLFNVGLEDRLIIVPFTNITEAVTNSTCQCYVKSLNTVKIINRFSNSYLNTEFKSQTNYYYLSKPDVYNKPHDSGLTPARIKYSLYDLLLIAIFNIKLIILYVFKSKLPIL